MSQLQIKNSDASSSTDSSFTLRKSVTMRTPSTSPEILIEGDVQILGVIEVESDILSVKYTSDYQYIAVGMTNGSVDLYIMSNGVHVRSLVEKQRKSPVTSIKHGMTSLHRRTLTATYVDGSVRCWDIHSGSLKYSIKEKRQVLGLAYHPRLSKLITYGDDSRIHLYDEESSSLEHVYAASDVPEIVDGHSSRIFSGCFNPARPFEFITGGWDDTIQVWDSRISQSIRHMSGAHICGDGLDINKSGKQIVSFAWQTQNPHQLWDYATGKLLMNFEVDSCKSKLYCGQFLPKDLMVMGGSEQNLLRIVDKSNLAVVCRIRNLPVGIYCLDSGDMTKPKSMPKICFSSGKKVYECEFVL